MDGHQGVTIWDRGDYPLLARRLEPAADALAEAAGQGQGRLALDVAAGDGSATVALARMGWSVAASDSSSRMVERGRLRSRDLGVVVDWCLADMTALPVSDGSASLVVSSFGLIFAPDPESVLQEVARVLRPGGRLLFSAWPEGGYMAQMTQTMMTFFPTVRDNGVGPLSWGSERTVRQRLATHFGEVTVRTSTLPWQFSSSSDARDLLQRASPAHIAAQAALGESGAAMMDAVEQHLAEYAEDGEGVSVDAEYLLVSARATTPG